jgi:hypothetical protein
MLVIFSGNTLIAELVVIGITLILPLDKTFLIITRLPLSSGF